MLDQISISAIIFISLCLFLWGRWRYDVVALLALFSAMIMDLLPLGEIFTGFIHPIVVLVVAMVIISKGLVNSGAIDIAARRLKLSGRHPVLQLVVLTAFTAFISSFINSLGALALVIPIAIRMAKQSGAPLSMFLMPLAFASHFGGGITLIGSVSNIIVSGFRADISSPFGFFDFAPVAVPIAVAGVLFVALGGWRLIPRREDISAPADYYVTEIKVPDNSPTIGKTIEEFRDFSKENFVILALLRGGQRIPDPSPFIILGAEDVLIVEAEPDALEAIIVTTKLELVWKKPFAESGEREDNNFEIIEAVIPAYSNIIGETAHNLGLHHNYRVNLLALRRSGARIAGRPGEAYFRQGDVLIIQGHTEELSRFVGNFGLLLLKEREFHFEGKKERALFASGIFALAVAISIAMLFPIHIVFSLAALAMIVTGFIPVKEMYHSVDLSIVVLLAAMLQLGKVFHDSGASISLAGSVFLLPWEISPEMALALIFLTSIWLSDVLNNATVALLFAPVAISMAGLLGVSPDPFLMAIAIGSASSYLLPFGHQSNIFIMNIAGYRVNDYWRLGLPLELITFAVGFPLILRYWPF